jgi:hypothetical protein
MAFKKAHFAFTHPTFGKTEVVKKSEPFKNTVYYYWYEFLKRNNEYRDCCIQGGSGAMAGLYEDFGNVLELDFKTWWQENDRGARLFAEAPIGSVRQIRTAEDLDVSDGMLNVCLPLELPRRFLEKELRKLLDDYHNGARGVRTNKASTAKYPLDGHFDLDNLSKCLSLLDLKASQPALTLWQLAVKARIGKAEHRDQAPLRDSKACSYSRSVLANTVKRHLNEAEAMVRNVGEGRFPGPRSKPRVK